MRRSYLSDTKNDGTHASRVLTFAESTPEASVTPEKHAGGVRTEP
jgi:hypothetical protein